MPCYHPILAIDVSGDQFDILDKKRLDFHWESYADRLGQLKRQGRVLELPCRHCVGCRLDKSREWANRIVMEQQYHAESWFLTLTYDDEHLPPAYPVDPATGEILSIHATLVKKDLQDFMKRLRKNSQQKVRYFAAGEYGSQTYRPHYHVLLFGLHLTDLKPMKKSFCGNQYYTSDFIAKCWPKGLHILGQVTWQSAAYVARYTMKKATHGYIKDYYEKAGIQPEFQTMSLRPAIGMRYFEDHPDLFDYDTFSVSTPQGGRKMTPPELFRKKYNKSHPIEAIERSYKTGLKKYSQEKLKLLLTDLDLGDILRIEEEKALSRLSGQIRDLI